MTKKVASTVSNNNAYAVIHDDGTISAWGDTNTGGSSPSTNKDLGRYQTIFPASYAFAAITDQGKVIAWGRSNSGGNASNINTQLETDEKFRTIYSTSRAFAAVTTKRRVISWGHPGYGGSMNIIASGSIGSSMNTIAGGLTMIDKMCGNDVAFGAIDLSGNLYTWGNSNWGGNVSAKAVGLNIVECFPKQRYYY